MSQAVRILYIEDDASLAHLVTRRLSRLGFVIETASSGEEGLAQLNQAEFDILIVDYQLPKMDGLAVLESLLEQRIDIPTIMVSGQDSISVVVQAMKLNCRDYLVKEGSSYLELLPVHIDTLLQHRKLENDKREAEHQVRRSEASLSKAQALAHIGNWEWRVGSVFSWWSEEEYRLFDLDKASYPDGVTFSDFIKRVHPQDKEVIFAIQSRAQHENILDYEYRVLLNNGDVRWVYAKTEIARDDVDNIISWSGTTQDITQRKQAEQQQFLAQSVFETASEAILVADSEQRIISVNPAFTRITGYSKEEVIGQTPRILKSGNHPPVFYKKMWRALKREGAWSGEIWNRNKDGALFAEWLSIATIRDHNGDIERYVSIFNDITQHKEAEQLIEFQANYDSLTKLPNRNLFADRLSTAMKSSQRDGSHLAVMFLDLDKFKFINDTLGHQAGDELLKQTAERLCSVLRESDTVSRFGGDEFTVVLTDLEQGIDAEFIAEKMLAVLARPYLIEDQELYVTGSIGITLYPDDATDIESLYKNADQAMYVSKEAGRNQFSFFTQHMQSQAKLRQEAISELRHAVEQEQFEVYFQPVVDVKQKTLFGAEALLRWQHPEKGTILPDDFIELAEETGLINVIGKWVIDETLRYVKRWQDLGFDLSVSVNKSPKQFHSEECKFDISNKLTDMGIQPHRFAIEITEQVLIEHKDWISPVLTCYRDAGVQIILDDFGHGYTALSHLSAFPIDIVKIDKHFVDSLESEPQPLKAMTAMIHHLGKTVAIEGIESTEQMTWLTQEQGQLFQGHLYSEALPAEQFEQRFCRDREWEAYV